MLVAACQESRPSLLINQSGEAIQVTYSMTLFDIGGRKADCRMDFLKPKFAPNGSDEWRVAPDYRYDRARCEMSFDLPAGMTAHIDENGSCGARDSSLDASPVEPTINRLAIVGKSRSLTLNGAQVPAAFRKRWWSSRCEFVYEAT